jgi:Homeodomain-like domain
LREKASREFDTPGTTRRHVAAETIRDWLYAYRRHGFDGLKPRPRADQGQARALPQAVADQLCALKEVHPTYSVGLVIGTARAQQRVPANLPLPPATVHRLLGRHGLMARPTDAPTSQDRGRFSYDAANAATKQPDACWHVLKQGLEKTHPCAVSGGFKRLHSGRLEILGSAMERAGSIPAPGTNRC